ncbi:hypothetical protein ACJJTC_019031 [Scirpophaga incertulas]
MNAVNKKGPIYDPGLCRCCGATKRCRLLNHEYDFMGQKEIYSDMFVDCFGLLLSHLDSEPLDRLICATCVLRLREATSFRQQVLRCEEQLLQARLDSQQDVTDIQIIDVKTEETHPEVSAEEFPVCNNSDADLDYDDDPQENMSIKVKLKKSAKPKKALKRAKNKTSKLKKKGLESVFENDKEEMLESLAKMSERLQKMREQNDYDEVKEKPAKLKTISNENKILFNASQIVINSYACPFDSSFSDYYCLYCRKVFTDPSMLREHTLTHDPRTYKSFAVNKKQLQIDIHRIDCRLCSKSIDDLDSFKDHITSVHGKNLYEVSNEFLKFRLTVNNLSCLECKSTFSFFHALKKHMAEHFGTWVCDVCGAHYFEERMLVLHQKSHQRIDENYPCKECGKNFKSKHSRYLHIARAHKKEPTYQCYKCDEVFFSYSLRYRHMIEVHEEQRLFPCENCDRTYDSRKSLREHNRRFHLKILKHQCAMCDKRFYLPSRLKEHMAVHTGERNFRCEYCGKSYPRLRGLKVHMQSHSAEKKFKCVLCNASFTQNVHLRNHMKRQHQSLVDESFHD